MIIRYLFVLFLYSQLSLAQTQPKELPAAISLEEAIAIATENSIDLKVKGLNVELGKEKIKESQDKRLPNVYANYDLQRNLIIQTTVLPANAFNPNASANELTPLRFGTNWTSNAGLNASFKILDANLYGAIQEKKAEVLLSQTEKELTKNILEADVSLAYAECVIAIAQLNLATEDTANSRANLEVIRAKFDNGRAFTNTINEAEIGLNNAKSRFYEAQKILIAAQAKLIYHLGYAPQASVNVSLKDDLSSLFNKLKQPLQNNNDFKASLSFLRLNQQLNLTQIKLNSTQRGYLPTISLNGFYGANYLNNNLQLNRSENWFGNSFIALSVRMPITEGIERRKRINQLKIQMRIDQENLATQQLKNSYEATKIYQDLVFISQDLAIKEANKLLAEKNYQLSLQLFKEGRLLANELTQADFLYQQAKNNYLKTIYQYIQASILWDRLKKS